MKNKMRNNFPKVSVCVVTYNQKSYLRECLESLVNQDYSFKYEVIVGDDGSTDGSSEVIKEFALKYPDIIVPLLHSVNMGPTKNYFATHEQAKGIYVCHMDGDDVAFPSKLRLQTDFLDSNPSYQFVWHRVNIFNDNRSSSHLSHRSIHPSVNILKLSFGDLLMYGSVGFHSSMMYRNNAHAKIIKKNLSSTSKEVLDFFIAVELLSSGALAANMNELLGGYRFNISGKTASKKKKEFMSKSPTKILLLEHLNEFLRRYPDHKSSIFVNAMTNAVGDLKNLRGTAFGYLLLGFKSCTLLGVYLFFKNIKYLSKLRTTE